MNPHQSPGWHEHDIGMMTITKRTTAARMKTNIHFANFIVSSVCACVSMTLGFDNKGIFSSASAICFSFSANTLVCLARNEN